MINNIVSRAYNSFSIDKLNGIITKQSQTERLLDESKYYIAVHALNIPEISIFFPRLINVKVEGTSTTLSLELYGYNNLAHYLPKPTDLSSYELDHLSIWTDIFVQLNTIFSKWDNIKDPKLGKNTHIHDMYITKTESEYQKFKAGWRDRLGPMFDSPYLTINRVKYDNFESIWSDVKKYIETNMSLYNSVMIHGDCCFSNILYQNSDVCSIFKFIDPRGSFGKLGIYGDRRYDVAKLYHSVDGKYEYIINDLFYIGDNLTTIDYGIQLGPKFRENYEYTHIIQTRFEEIFFRQFSKKQIKILEGCIFIGMCARHYDNINRQRMMYATGIKLLNDAMIL